MSIEQHSRPDCSPKALPSEGELFAIKPSTENPGVDVPRTVRLTGYIREDTHRVLKRLSQEWRASYAEVTRILVQRGLTIEAALEMNWQIYAHTPDGKAFPFEDDRPRTRRPHNTENEFTKFLKSK